MKKIILLTLSVFFLGGCTSSTKTSEPVTVADSGFLKSVDGGATFEQKGLLAENKGTLSGVDVLSLARHTTNGDILYIGTTKSGIYRTTDRAESWEQLVFPPEKVYALALDPTNGDHLYATGVYENISKLYVSQNAGADWREAYTEPGKGSVITSLAIDPHNPNHLLMGTSQGIMIESRDAGESWKNIATFEAALTQIIFVEKTNSIVLALVQGQDIVLSEDNGTTWKQKDPSALPFSNTFSDNKPVDGTVQELSNQNSIIVDQYIPGTLYTGTSEGVYKSTDYGRNWKPLNILEAAKNFPIRSLAVNPKNSNEIVFVSGRAFYKSKDGGTSWSSTVLPIERPVYNVTYDPVDSNTLYLLLKK